MKEYEFSEDSEGYPDLSGCTLVLGDSNIAIYHDNKRRMFYMMKRISGDLISTVEISMNADKQAYELAYLLGSITQ